MSASGRVRSAFVPPSSKPHRRVLLLGKKGLALCAVPGCGRSAEDMPVWMWTKSPASPILVYWLCRACNAHLESLPTGTDTSEWATPTCSVVSCQRTSQSVRCLVGDHDGAEVWSVAPVCLEHHLVMPKHGHPDERMRWLEAV